MSDKDDRPQHPARATYDANTRASQDGFLKHYAALGNITAASLAANVGVTMCRQWRKEDVLGFAERFQDAKDAFADNLESIVLKRIMSPEGNRGSDPLCMFMLNGLRPEKYKPELRQLNAGPPPITQIIIHLPPGASTGSTPLVVDGKAKLVPEEEE